MTIYKYECCPEELYYSNLKLLCQMHELSYDSVYAKLRREKQPLYQKGNVMVTEHKLYQPKDFRNE
jgi:hypothetical protein